MWMVDPKTLRLTSVNDSAVTLFGYTQEQLRTMSVIDLLVPEDMERLRRALPSRPSAGDGGGWTILLPGGTRVKIRTRFHFTTVFGETQQFTFVTEIYGHPDFNDGSTAPIGAAAAGTR
jgi:PAS domain-containing protein